MLSLAAIDDFTTRDLSAPSVLRIRHVLSGVINFFLFEQEQAAEFLEPLQDEQEELAAQETKLLQRNEELRELLAGEKERRERNGRRVEELQGEHGARQAQLQEATGVGHRNAEWAKRSKQERVEAGEAIVSQEGVCVALAGGLTRILFEPRSANWKKRPPHSTSSFPACRRTSSPRPPGCTPRCRRCLPS